MDWSHFKQAFVVRVNNGRIIRRTLIKYVPDDCKCLLKSPVNSPKNCAHHASATESSMATSSSSYSTDSSFKRRQKKDKK